jgi:SUMO ligase MMS21 Smc5/6 complex component
MIHPKIVKMLRINRMNEFAQISNLTDDESIIILEEYDNKDSIKKRKREIETLIEDYKKKIGDLTVEYHMLQSWVSPDGLD